MSSKSSPIRERDPKLYNKIRSDQDRRIAQHSTSITVARICPFCQQKISLLADGVHGAAQFKCPHCSETISLPPVVIG